MIFTALLLLATTFAVDCTVKRGCGQCLNKDPACKWSDELRCSETCPEGEDCYHADLFNGSKNSACKAYRKKTKKARRCRRKGSCKSCAKNGCNWAEGKCDLECGDRINCITDRNQCSKPAPECSKITKCPAQEKVCEAAQWVPDTSNPCKEDCGRWVGCAPDCIHEDRTYNGNGPEVVAYNALECYELCKAENTPEWTKCFFYTYNPSFSLGKRCKLFKKVSTTKKFFKTPGTISGNTKCHPEHGKQA